MSIDRYQVRGTSLPRRIAPLQRCGPLLPMFRGLCLSVGPTTRPTKTAEPIEVSFGVCTRQWDQGTVYPGSLQEKRQFFWGGHLPACCNVSDNVSVNMELKATLHEQVRYRGTLHLQY